MREHIKRNILVKLISAWWHLSGILKGPYETLSPKLIIVFFFSQHHPMETARVRVSNSCKWLWVIWTGIPGLKSHIFQLICVMLTDKQSAILLSCGLMANAKHLLSLTLSMNRNAYLANPEFPSVLPWSVVILRPSQLALTPIINDIVMTKCMFKEKKNHSTAQLSTDEEN